MRATFAPLSQRTLTADCYDALKRAIVNFDLPPGTVLSERDLASQFGTSKTPVREALARLISDGFVVSGPGRKLVVASLHPGMVRDLYRVRLLLEPAAIRGVASSIDDTVIDELERLVADAAAALEVGESITFVAANERFHTYLIELTGNEFLLTIFRNLFEHVRRIRSAIYATEHETHQYAFALQGLANHRAIIDALKTRDPDAAERAMRIDILLFLDVASVSDTEVTVRVVSPHQMKPVGASTS